MWFVVRLKQSTHCCWVLCNCIHRISFVLNIYHWRQCHCGFDDNRIFHRKLQYFVNARLPYPYLSHRFFSFPSFGFCVNDSFRLFRWWIQIHIGEGNKMTYNMHAKHIQNNQKVASVLTLVYHVIYAHYPH